jgi:hypothetical protein
LASKLHVILTNFGTENTCHFCRFWHCKQMIFFSRNRKYIKFYFKFLLDIISFSYTFCFIFYKTSFKWIISTSSTILLPAAAAHILSPQSQPSFGFQSSLVPPTKKFQLIQIKHVSLFRWRLVLPDPFKWIRLLSTASRTIIMNACLMFPFGFFLLEIFDFSRKA